MPWEGKGYERWRKVAIMAVLAAGGSCGAKFEQKNRFFFPYFYTMIETYWFMISPPRNSKHLDEKMGWGGGGGVNFPMEQLSK